MPKVRVPKQEPEPETDRESRTVLDIPATALFYDLSKSREELVRSVARNNIGLRSEEIATVSNRFIGWTLMLCIAEDRGLIAEGTGQKIRESGETARWLVELFRSVSDTWNDETDQIPGTKKSAEEPVIEDVVLRKILSRLSSPARSYDFSTIPTETIAQVAGQYLGRTIKRSAAHHAIVIEKRDEYESGMSPTPEMIRYMVRSTLQEVEANRSCGEILPIRILDPACSAGLALLFAYQYLIDRKRGRPTFAERQEILIESIHGVDIDRYAIAMTKMLLFFKLCEGERADTLPGDFFTIAGQVFCDIGHTIRYGNALVGPEIVNDESWAFCPARERHRLNLFAWNSSFPEIFASGGFDAVVGNLPAGPLAVQEWIQRYFQRHYSVFDPTADRSGYFVEKGLSLLRTGGSLGVLMNDRWLRAKSGRPLRHLVSEYQIGEIVRFGGPGDATDHPVPCILRLQNRPPSHALFVTLVDPDFEGNFPDFIRSNRYPIDQATLDDRGWTLRDTRVPELLEKVRRHGTPLEEFVLEEHRCGLSLAPDNPLIIGEPEKKQLVKDDPKSRTVIRSFVSAAQIGRYEIAGDRKFLIFIPRGWTNRHPAAVSNPWRWLRKKFPAIGRYLKGFEDAKDRAGQGDYWWETPGDPDFWLRKDPRIFFRNRFCDPAFAFDYGRGIADESVCVILSSSLYLLGVLNSRLISFVFHENIRNSQSRPDSGWNDLKDLPVYTPDFDNPADAARHKQMEGFVLHMLELHRYLPLAKNDLEKRLIQQEIDGLDVRIDALVYELYGLTAEEVAVVEGVARKTDRV